MHRVDAADFDTVLSQRRFKDTVPGTLIAQGELNAFQEEIAHAVEGAGLTLASSSAADAATGWNQLREACKHLGRIGLNEFPGLFLISTLYTVTSDPFTLDPALNGPYLELRTDGTPRNNGLINIVENDFFYGSHVLFVENATENVKFVGSPGRRVRMPQGSAMMFKYNSAYGTTFKWQPLTFFNTTADLVEGGANFYYTEARFNTSLASKSSTDLAEGSRLFFTNARADARIASAIGGTVEAQHTQDIGFTVELRKGTPGAGTLLSTGANAARWEKRGQHVVLRLPTLTGTIAASDTLYLCRAGDTRFPTAISPAETGGISSEPLLISNNGAMEMGYIEDTNQDGFLHVYRMGAAAFSAGTAGIVRKTLSYHLTSLSL